MKFKKRFLMVFLSLTLLVGMMGGVSVSAVDENRITLDDLFKMNSKELSQVSQDTLRAALDEIAKIGNAGEEIDIDQANRIYKQWLAAVDRSSLDSIYDIPLPVTDSVNLTIGTDTRVWSAEYGYYSLDGFSDASYNVSLNRQYSYTGVTGWGAGSAYAYTGFTFYVEGDSSAWANVEIWGYLNANTNSTAPIPDAHVKYDLVVTKITSPTNEVVEPIVEISGWNGQYDDVCTGVRAVQFDPGSYYRVTLRVTTSASYWGIGGAQANAGILDSFSQWSWVDINWI